jgi:Na+/H+-dicarboxylate symporter
MYTMSKNPEPDGAGNQLAWSRHLTKKIFIAMVLGAITGLIIKILPANWHLQKIFTDSIFEFGGNIFINLIKMLVVPLVFFSLLSGICNLGNITKIGKISLKTIGLFVLTTASAIILAILVASVLQIGVGMRFPMLHSALQVTTIPSLEQFVTNIFPSNFFQALVDTNILQIIVFAIVIAIAINAAGERGKRIAILVTDINAVVIKAVMLVMLIAPYGVFALIAILFAKLGLAVIVQLLNYFLTVILVLVLHTALIYSALLKFGAHLGVRSFFRKITSVMLFAFSVSSSNASLPITLETVERKLGVDNSVASFVLSLGINMNKNGTAIMQAVAAIFIAHAYGVTLGAVGSLMLFVTTLLMSIGTAGAPSVGIFGLAIILKQLGLPIEGVAWILAVDRLLDMLRTAVNVVGNAVIACVVGRSEGRIDLETYYA